MFVREIIHYLQHMTMRFVSINPSDSWDVPDLGHVLPSGINKKIKNNVLLIYMHVHINIIYSCVFCIKYRQNFSMTIMRGF